MVDNLQIISITSLIIQNYYQQLKELSYQNRENDPEYEIIIDKLKQGVKGEKEIYHSLSDEDLEKGLAYFKKNGLNSDLDVRINLKLSQLNNERKCNKVHAELDNIILAKIMLDVFKTITERLLSIDSNDVSAEEIEELLLKNNICKYYYLTINDLIEEIALECRFDILAMPTIDLSRLEKDLNMPIIKGMSEFAYNCIITSLNHLLKRDAENKDSKNTYLKIYETTKIEILLPYLNKEHLIKLSIYFDELNIDKDNIVFRKIRKQIKKQKEKLN